MPDHLRERPPLDLLLLTTGQLAQALHRLVDPVVGALLGAALDRLTSSSRWPGSASSASAKPPLLSLPAAAAAGLRRPQPRAGFTYTFVFLIYFMMITCASPQLRRAVTAHRIPVVNGGFRRSSGSLFRCASARYLARMLMMVRLFFGSLVGFAASRAALAVEILALRHQLCVLERPSPARLPLTCWDRALWAFLLRHWSGWKDSLVLVKPEIVIAWHRRAFRLFWRQKSLAGRPTTRAEIRRLIRQMAQENRTWGAPTVHGELLKLGYVVGERTVSRYLARIRPGPTKPRSQTWATFLKNHARDIVAADMFVVPTIRFQVLYVFIILGLERRRLIFANVTTNPTAEWLAQQVVNAFPWDTAPRFLIRDRDGAYGLAFSARLRGLGIREIRTAVRAPLMNAFAERVISTLPRVLRPPDRAERTARPAPACRVP